MMLAPNLSRKRRLFLEQEIHRQVTDRIAELCKNPEYLALPLNGPQRTTARRRILTGIRRDFPDATNSLLQRVILQVAQDLSNIKRGNTP